MQLVINTYLGWKVKHDDSHIRQAAIQHKIPYITTTAAARATVAGIETVERWPCGSEGASVVSQVSRSSERI